MDNRTLDQLIDQAIVDILSDYLVQQIKQPSKKLLVLFTGAVCGFQEALSSLVHLSESGYRFKVVFSNAAKTVLADKLSDITQKLQLGHGDIIFENDMPDVFDLLREYKTLLIPTLTVNTVAKVAHGINDCLSTSILFQAISQNKQVLAAIDGCCPNNKERIARGFNAAEPFKKQLTDNIEQLKSYGVVFASAKNLAYKILGKSQAITMQAVGVVNNISHSPSIYRKRVFARQDAVVYSHSILRIASNVLITPSAMDELQRRRISIVRE